MAVDFQTLSSRSPSPLQRGQADQVLNELALYGRLINRLLLAVDAAEQHIEPSLRLRIRDDLVGTHKRESSRFRTLHGRRSLQKTITGLAWDVIKTEFEAEPSSASTTEQEVSILVRRLLVSQRAHAVSYFLSTRGMLELRHDHDNFILHNTKVKMKASTQRQWTVFVIMLYGVL